VNILGIYGEDYPWDVRIEKVFGGLARRGHDVHLVCRNVQRSAATESVDGISCHRVLGPSIGRPWQSLLTIPAFVNPIWRSAIRRAIVDSAADLVIVRDLPLAPLAIREAHRAGLSCLVDMAENHPEMWREVCRHDRWKLPSYIMKNPSLGKRMELDTVRGADKIVVVVEEMREHLLSLGADPFRVVVVSNTPDIDRVPVVRDRVQEPPGDRTLDLVYTGFVTPRRGLDQVLLALARLRDLAPIPRLHIVGDGEHLSALRSQTKKLELTDQVIFHGWVDHSQVAETIAASHIGIVPHLKTGNTDNTIPNKIFDYMAQGRPVLVSDARPLERIVGELDCGLVFGDANVSDLAEQIRKLADPHLRHRLGRNGHRAIRNRYNWAVDFQRFVETIESPPLVEPEKLRTQHARN